MSGKANVVVIVDRFIDPGYVIYMSQDDSSRTLPLASSIAQSKLRTGSLSPTGKTITIFQKQDPTYTKWDDAGAE